MTWEPTPKYRFSTKLGMQGIEVWALQINLNQVDNNKLTLDGVFGPATDKAVREYQKTQSLEVDGVAGVMTQRSLVIKLTTEATTKYHLPPGLLKSLASNESGFVLASYSKHPSDGGFDLGPYQRSFPPADMNSAGYQNALNAASMANFSGSSMRAQKDTFAKAPKVGSVQRAWELAVLNHNWPFAAHNLAFLGSIYPNAAEDTAPQDWIKVASGGRLSTPRQWVQHYIDAATVFVTTWPS
jgi:peptidoglycan hydrolase-like protein with peptidoglycan-binding domain